MSYTKKKSLSEDSEVETASELADDEEIIVSNVRTIRKTKRDPKPEARPDDEIDVIAGEVFEEADVFEEGTLGSLLNRSDDEEIRSAQCNVLVIRKPDSAGEKFVKPCTSRMSESPIRNVELAQSQVDIEEMVRTYYGGGHYYLQIQLGGKIQTGWNCDLADPPDAVSKARSVQYPAENPSAGSSANHAPPVNPFQEKIEQMKLEREYDELRFGDERKRMRDLEAEAKELRDKVLDLEKQNNLSDPMRFLAFAQSTGNQTLVEKALDNLLDKGDDEKSHWIVDLVKTGFEHKEELAGIAQIVLGGLAPQPKPASIHSILKAAPPGSSSEPQAAVLPRSTFRRRTAEPSPQEPEPTPDLEKDENLNDERS
jgi:hypothetical protein